MNNKFAIGDIVTFDLSQCELTILGMVTKVKKCVVYRNIHEWERLQIFNEDIIGHGIYDGMTHIQYVNDDDYARINISDVENVDITLVGTPGVGTELGYFCTNPAIQFRWKNDVELMVVLEKKIVYEIYGRCDNTSYKEFISDMERGLTDKAEIFGSVDESCVSLYKKLNKHYVS